MADQNTMDIPRHRIRLRFRKEGDLRFISHRDLVRVFERAFRRAGFELSMSEGFHPKARMSFPLALSLGIEGLDEVMEVEFRESLAAEEIGSRLRPLLPDGLVVEDIETMKIGASKRRVERVVYEIPVPKDRWQEVTEAIGRVMSQSAWQVASRGRDRSIDVMPQLAALELKDGTLRIEQIITAEASFNPRDLLIEFHLVGLESLGHTIKRTQVKLENKHDFSTAEAL